MSSDRLELRLGTPQQTHIPSCVQDLMNYVSSIKNVWKRLSTLDDYVEKLEQKIQKMNASERDHHYRMLLLKDVVEFLKREGEKMRKKMEYEESKSNLDDKEKGAVMPEKDGIKKRTWMKRSNHKRQKSGAEITESYKLSIGGREALARNRSIGFGSFATISTLEKATATKAAESVFSSEKESSRVEMGYREEVGSQQEYTQKKNRRCWSPELHASFMAAVQLLGGLQEATPKRIRGIMQVEGLTNDQVKSHLQKVRLQTKESLQHIAETADQNNANPANQQARTQGLLAPEGQQNTRGDTRRYSGFPAYPPNLAGILGRLFGAGSVDAEEKDEKPGSIS